MRRLLSTCVLPLILFGCTTNRMTVPTRAASEEMMISEAADAAAMSISMKLPDGSKAFVDGTYFDGTDSKYALSAIRQSLLQQGNALASKADDATVIIEVRAGALSIDSVSRIIGIPEVKIDPVSIPGLSIANNTRYTGVAKFSMFAYDKASGKLVAIVAPVTGLSHRSFSTTSTVISWSKK